MTEAIRGAGAEQREFITCRIGDDDYCVDIMTVREIRGWTPSTKLPHVPNFVLRRHQPARRGPAGH